VPNCNCNGTPAPTPETDAQGRQIFTRLPNTTYLVVVEARPLPGGASVGTQTLPGDPAVRPDLQIEVNRDLGIAPPPLADVDCRSGQSSSQWGGVPGIAPANFGAGQAITDALTDLACRFGQAHTVGSECTLDSNGSSNFLGPNKGDVTVRQFCMFTTAKAQFPSGDTIVTVQAQDVSHNIGPTAQMVMRVVTPTP